MRVCTRTCLTDFWCSPSSVPGAGVVVDLPAHGLVGHAHRLEQVVVEPVGARQQGGDAGEEESRLGALNDPVVVRRREGHDLAQAELGQHPGVGRLVARGVAECADPDDGALSRHEPRHRLDGAERARVGERHRRAREVVGSDPAGVDLADQVLVGDHEEPEVESVGVADAGHEEGAAPVGLLLVDREPQPDVLVMDDPGLARSLDVGDEGGVERRHVVRARGRRRTR